MATRIISRAEGGIVPLSHTTARVVRPSNYLLCHYTGGSGPRVGDGKSDAQHMRELQSQMINNGKTWEYNYIITAPEGLIWEVAGEFQSAHCLNANSFAYGVQMNLGVGCPPNQAMIDSWRWLRYELTRVGQLSPNHVAKPHYYLRDTACCGGLMATAPGGPWNSPTGQGHQGDLLPFMLVPWTGVPSAPDGGLIVTPEDKAYLDQKFAQVNLDQSNDRRNCWRAPEMNNIMRDRANEGAFDAIRRADLINAIVAAIVAQVGHVDPAVIKEAIVSAMAGVTVPVDSAAIADAVVDELRGRLEA